MLWPSHSIRAELWFLGSPGWPPHERSSAAVHSHLSQLQLVHNRWWPCNVGSLSLSLLSRALFQLCLCNLVFISSLHFSEQTVQTLVQSPVHLPTVYTYIQWRLEVHELFCSIELFKTSSWIENFTKWPPCCHLKHFQMSLCSNKILIL